MKFVDEVEIKVTAGKGGDGCISFRREKFVPRGGPDGGDGGKGGSVIFTASNNISTLSDLRYQKVIKAQDGENGKGKDRYGKKGADTIITIPIGTILKDLYTGEIIYDFTYNGEHFEAAKGGRGGRGNIHFLSSTNRAPFYAQKGEEGEEREYKIELKLLADVGLIGYPNAGKSTLISIISNAKPKIADYPFTTLVPNLGIVTIDYNNSFTVADIPGLIDGAAEGKGLGHQFLKHIERTKLLVHLIDISPLDEESIFNSYKNIREELRKFNEDIIKKNELICLTKNDIASEADIKKLVEFLKIKTGKEIYSISSVTRGGVKDLLNRITECLRVDKK